MEGGFNRRQSRQPLELDEILDLLSHPHRRTILRTLKNNEENIVPLDEVLSNIAVPEADHSGGSGLGNRLVWNFVHHHGPKLREAGVIDYDISSDEIRYYPNELVETALETIDALKEEL